MGHIGLLNPISDGVAVCRVVLNERLGGIEVQAAPHGAFIIRRGEISREARRNIALHFQKGMNHRRFLKRQQNNIVGREMGIIDGADRIIMNRIGPYGVVAHIGVGGWHIGLGGERQLLAAGVLKVAVHVLQGKDAVSARGNAFDAEAAAAVRTRHALQWGVGESRIVQIRMEAYEDARHRT